MQRAIGKPNTAEAIRLLQMARKTAEQATAYRKQAGRLIAGMELSERRKVAEGTEVSLETLDMLTGLT